MTVLHVLTLFTLGKTKTKGVLIPETTALLGLL